MMHPYFYDYGSPYSYGPWGLVWHIVITIILIAVVIGILRTIFGGRRGRHMRNRMMWHSDALSILEERYAKGEISDEEFTTRRKTLLGE